MGPLKFLANVTILYIIKRKIMDKKVFKQEILNFVTSRENNIRKGQAVFNYIDEKYGIARDIQHIDNIDCFYDDYYIDEFLDAAYNRLYTK